MEAAARESARAGSDGWEIVGLGPRAWEVVVVDTRAPAPEAVDDQPGAGMPDALVGRLHRTDQRLAAIEARLEGLGDAERRLTALERAHAAVERRIDERDAELRQELEQIYRDAERRVAATQSRIGWRQRRHELKLAKLRTGRTIHRAEEQLAERSEESLGRIERETVAAERRVRGASEAAEFGVSRNEDRVSVLMERIAVAEERLSNAERRAGAAEARAAATAEGAEL
jgi:exonuclease VII large subunit